MLGDGAGGALVLGERECSVQRRHQKLLEESPSPFLSDEARDASSTTPRSARCARRATATPARSSACSAATSRFYFMEMNTRLQVEHPVSEEVTGIDLVRSQLRLAAGEPLAQARASRRRTGTRSSSASTPRIRRAASCRRPAPLRRFRPPLGRGVRVDTHGYEGYTVPPNYDSLVAKLIVSDADRAARRSRVPRRRCAEFEVEGIATTLPLFREMVTSEPAFRSGVYTTAYLEEAAGRLSSLSA